MAAAAHVVVRHKRLAAEARRQAQARRTRDETEAGLAFDALDVNKSGALTRAQTRDLLTRVCAVDVRDDGLDLVIAHARKHAATMAPASGSAGGASSGGGSSAKVAVAPPPEEAEDAAPAVGPDEVLQREAVLVAVRKFRYYLSKVKEIDAMFAEFDTNQSGQLEKSQLRAAIQNLESHLGGAAQHEAWGMIVHLEVSDEDVEFILAHCDEGESGGITKAELLPALAAWKQLAEEHVEYKKKSPACCVIA